MRAHWAGVAAVAGLAMVVGLAAKAAESSDGTPHREVHRLHLAAPAEAHLAAPFDVVIDSPADQVADVTVSQTQDNPILRHADDLHAAVVRRADGVTVARVIPLMQGYVTFSLVASFKDAGVELDSVLVDVGAPVDPPKQILGDRAFLANFWANKDSSVLARVGWRNGQFHPIGQFASVPDHWIDLQGLAQFQLLPGEGDQVVFITPDGRFATLRVGTAKVEVSFAGASTVFPINVSP